MDLSFIRDPATVRARVYVGALADGATRQEMDEYFQKYGNIIGVVVNRGFGFIQFETEEMAAAALKDKHGMIHGKKIFVKPAQSGVGNTEASVDINSHPTTATAIPVTPEKTEARDTHGLIGIGRVQPGFGDTQDTRRNLSNQQT
uniref:Uncharacterized protein n=1 Tax=Phlebotomus papatasi TaxID=29031 RepID=A0A1B0EVQ2_PHLPP